MKLVGISLEEFNLDYQTRYQCLVMGDFISIITFSRFATINFPVLAWGDVSSGNLLKLPSCT